MLKTEPGPQVLRWASWTFRDTLAAAVLFLATAAVTLWQNAHVAVLWDLSYTLDSATRIALGQTPYRDFPFAHAPLTFLIQAAIIRLTGRVFFHHVLYVAAAGGFGSVLTWRIALHSLRGRIHSAWPVALLLAAPLTVLGIYCILPLPSYDCDCAFSILVAVWLLQRLETIPKDPTRNQAILRGFVAGAALCLPVFFKQNIGLPFLAVSLAAILLLLCIRFVIRLTALPQGTNRQGMNWLPALKGQDSSLAANAPKPSSDLQAAEPLSPENREASGVDFSRTENTPDSTCRLKIAEQLSPEKQEASGHDPPRRIVPHVSEEKSWASAPDGSSSNHPSAPNSSPAPETLLAILAGAATTLALAALLIQLTAGLANYLHWTIQFAAQRRLPGLADMLAVYRDPELLWTLPCIAAAILLLRTKARWTHLPALALLSAPFVYTLYSLVLYDDADERGDTLLALWPLLLILATVLALFNIYKQRLNLTLRALLPIILLATINGAFLSQQLWGSTYAFWPLLILLVAEMLAFLASSAPAKQRQALAIAAVFSATLLLCGAFYTASEERLSYAQFPDEPAQHSAFPQLAGLATPGPYLSNFDELLRFAQANIPATDGLILLPGEDPFYFATGRSPQFPVLLFDPATDPYSPAQVAAEARRHNIRWLIIKRGLQIKEDPTPEREATLGALLPAFTLSAQLHGYDIYRRR